MFTVKNRVEQIKNKTPANYIRNSWNNFYFLFIIINQFLYIITKLNGLMIIRIYVFIYRLLFTYLNFWSFNHRSIFVTVLFKNLQCRFQPVTKACLDSGPKRNPWPKSWTDFVDFLNFQSTSPLIQLCESAVYKFNTYIHTYN